jgi:hypothetical protein
MALLDIFGDLLSCQNLLRYTAQVVIHPFGVFRVDGLHYGCVDAFGGVNSTMAHKLTHNFYPNPRLQGECYCCVAKIMEANRSDAMGSVKLSEQ